MNPLTIRDIRLHIVFLNYLDPIETSFGVEAGKAAVLVELETDEGIIGWGECAVEMAPGYGSETVATAHHILKEFMLPAVIGKTIHAPTDFPGLIQHLRGHPHTRAGLETAVWDTFAKTNDLRLTDCFAHYALPGHDSQGQARVGVSIGIQPGLDATLDAVRLRLAQGYGRIKLKIKRGWDVQVAQAVRAEFPDIMLMLDANSDYRLSDAEHLAKLDAFDLLMVEQPLAHDDIYKHGALQARLKTRVCLDESIKSASDLQVALAVGAIQVLNLKPARVGGFSEALELYRICVQHGLPLWIGGLMETGIGRAANLSFAALPAVSLPSDISATDRYFDPDLSEPPFVLGPGSTLAVADGAGIGVQVERQRLEQAKQDWLAHDPYDCGGEK